VKDRGMPGNDSPSTSDLLRLCREAAAAIAAGDGSRSDPNDLKEVEVATPYGYILGLYMRSRSMFDAITLYLLPNRLSTEAMILARALFEDSLRLERLSDLDEQARAGLILGWVNTSYTDELHLVADVERMGLGDMSQQRRAMATQQQKLSGYVERHGLSLRPFGDLRSLGRRLHRSADVGAYLISHKYVHGNEIALLSRVEVRESGTPGVCRPRPGCWSPTDRVRVGNTVSAARIPVGRQDAPLATPRRHLRPSRTMRGHTSEQRRSTAPEQVGAAYPPSSARCLQLGVRPELGSGSAAAARCASAS
jgi:hypothetical protein